MVDARAPDILAGIIETGLRNGVLHDAWATGESDGIIALFDRLHDTLVGVVARLRSLEGRIAPLDAAILMDAADRPIFMAMPGDRETSVPFQAALLEATLHVDVTQEAVPLLKDKRWAIAPIRDWTDGPYLVEILAEGGRAKAPAALYSMSWADRNVALGAMETMRQVADRGRTLAVLGHLKAAHRPDITAQLGAEFAAAGAESGDPDAGHDSAAAVAARILDLYTEMREEARRIEDDPAP